MLGEKELDAARDVAFAMIHSARMFQEVSDDEVVPGREMQELGFDGEAYRKWVAQEVGESLDVLLEELLAAKSERRMLEVLMGTIAASMSQGLLMGWLLHSNHGEE